jgi:lysine/ornithine N-monooxygenase
LATARILDRILGLILHRAALIVNELNGTASSRVAQEKTIVDFKANASVSAWS